MSDEKSLNAMQHHQTFESIKKTIDDEEFWLARDLQGVLDYSSWDKFDRVLQKAMTACRNSGQPENNHFSQVGKMVQLGSGAQRKTKDYKLPYYSQLFSEILGYSSFRNVSKAAKKAILAYVASGNTASDHVVEVNELIKSGKETTRAKRGLFLVPTVPGGNAYRGFVACHHGFPRGSMGTSKQPSLEAGMGGYLKELGYVA